MSNSGYQRLPQSPSSESLHRLDNIQQDGRDNQDGDDDSDAMNSTQASRVSRVNSPSTPNNDRPLRSAIQAEFNRPPPAWWKRALLILGIVVMGWLSVRLGGMGRGEKAPKVIYATRYSDEFKYRPAASPIITEHLKDGRIRLRGASVGGMGVREEDIPLTPAQIQARDEKRRVEAREKAKERLGITGKKRKVKAKGKNSASK